MRVRDEANAPVVEAACRHCKHPKAIHTARALACRQQTVDGNTHTMRTCNCTEWRTPRKRRRQRAKEALGWM